MSKLQEQAEKWRYKCIQLQNANEELERCIIDIKRQFQLEKEGLEKDLHELVSDVWNSIEEACIIKRKKRYE